MKKQIIIAVIVLAAGLILTGAGCGEKNTNQEQGIEQKEGQPPVNQIEREGEGAQKEINSGVTKEELDKLKADLEGMEYDDLNVLTK